MVDLTVISDDNTAELIPSVKVDVVVAMLPPVDWTTTVHPDVPASKSAFGIKLVPSCRNFLKSKQKHMCRN